MLLLIVSHSYVQNVKIRRRSEFLKFLGSPNTFFAANVRICNVVPITYQLKFVNASVWNAEIGLNSSERSKKTFAKLARKGFVPCAHSRKANASVIVLSASIRRKAKNANFAQNNVWNAKFSMINLFSCWPNAVTI